MAIDAHFLRTLIQDELATLSDARVVAHVMKWLVEPRSVLRRWDYGGQQYPCWIVLDDPAHSFSAIGFCEYGFGPKCCVYRKSKSERIDDEVRPVWRANL